YSRNLFLNTSRPINITNNNSTIDAPGAKFSIPAAIKPMTTAVSENKTAHKMDCLKLLPTSKLQATGMVSSAETSKAPTILIDTEMTSAVSTVNVIFRARTGSPPTLAASSSKVSKKYSFACSERTTMTTTATMAIVNKS